jgi:hypothetical protein
MKKGANWLATIALGAFSCAFGLALLEIGLRQFTIFPIHGKWANRATHPELGYVLKSTLPDADVQGFRNPAGQQMQLAALGDSHTYGFNVYADESWPRVVQELTGAASYNFGMPSYGVSEYPYLIKYATDNGAKKIVIGLFLDNDLKTYCERIHERPFAKHLALEQGVSLAGCSAPSVRPPPADVATIYTRFALASMVRFYLLDGERGLQDAPLANAPEERPPISYSIGLGQTKFKLQWLERAADRLDRKLADVETATQALFGWLQWAQQYTGQAGAELTVALIPSKYLLAAELGHAPEAIVAAANFERARREELFEFCKTTSILCIDVLPELVAQAKTGVVLFHDTVDTHPNPAGYAAYAKAIAGKPQTSSEN